MVEKSFFRYGSVLLFVFVLVMKNVNSYTDYRIAFVISSVLFIGVWYQSWVSFKYPKTLQWITQNNKSKLEGIKYDLKRKYHLFTKLLKENVWRVVVLFAAGVSMAVFLNISQEMFVYGEIGRSFNLSGDVCKETIKGETSIVPVENCEKAFTDFFGLFLKLLLLFSAINSVYILIGLPLIEQYNRIFNQYESDRT